MSIPIAYWKACLKKLRRTLLKERICDIHICPSKSSASASNTNPGYYCIVRIRNVIFIILLLILLALYRGSKYHDYAFKEHIPKESLTFLKFKEVKHPELSISEMKQLITEYNTNETILNKCSHECIKQNTVIFVIRVKKLTITIRYLLISLSQMKGIEEVLIIFSHSYFDENFNKFIRTIDFCRVQQIFFPYSLQVNPDTFPGFEKNDCPHDMDVIEALKKNCTGASTPDVRGFFRDPKKAEEKHHWWWTANKVFEGLKHSGEHNGLVVFLDEDLYLLDDFLYMIKKMQGWMGTRSRYDFFSLATPMKESDQLNIEETDTSKVKKSPWNANFSSALALNLYTWNKIVGHYDLFCNTDEFSWSKSLFQLSKNMITDDEKDRFTVATSVVPRAYKIGFDSFFGKVKRRAVFENVYRILLMQESIKDRLFPMSLNIVDDDKKIDDNDDHDIQEEILSGGWNDPRDKSLCLNMTIKKIKKIFFDMANQFL